MSSSDDDDNDCSSEISNEVFLECFFENGSRFQSSCSLSRSSLRLVLRRARSRRVDFPQS